MAITVSEDLINGCNLEVTPQGTTATRIFFIEGLTPGVAIMFDALNELAARGVSASAPHPANGGLLCSRIKPENYLNSQDKVKATVTYASASLIGVTPSEVVSFRAYTQQVTTERQYDRTPIFINYTPPGGSTFTKGGSATGTKAYGELIISRTENTDPSPRIAVVNCINNAPFRGGAAYTWLCSAIEVDQVNVGTFNVTYHFLYDEETWLKPVLYRSPATGLVPTDVLTDYDPTGDSGNGWINAQVNRDANFNALGL